MRFGICVYKDDIPAAERAGYDYVELTVTNVLPEVGDSEFKKLKDQLKPCRIRPEAWRRFVPPNLPVAGPEVDTSAVAEFLKITLGRIRELGGEVVVFGSPLSRKIPEDFSRDRAREQLVRFLQTSADIAKSHDLVVVIEPIIHRNCNVLNTVAQALSLAREVARPEIKVLADLFHMTGNDEPPQAVEQAGDSLFHVHMPVPEIPGLNEPRAINTILPDYPTGEFLRSLHNIGYDHRLSIEDLDRNFMNLEREAPLVLSHVKKVWEGLSA
jgi:sugar phosphate isomerase/epimerase